MSLAGALGLSYFLSEFLLSVTRRSRSKTGTSQDRSTLGMLWLAIVISVVLALFAMSRFPFARLPQRELLNLIGVILFALGIVVRWWSIIVLGRFFTVDVTIEKDHEIVQAGPYRFVRHPSYTGVLLAFLGWGLTLHNWLSLLVLFLPIALAFARRISVEEQALRGALGTRYADYMARTKRLVPFVY